MGLVDIIILIVVVGLLGCILFFNFYKGKGKDKCCGCPYKSKCGSEKCNCGENKEETQQTESDTRENKEDKKEG